MIVDIIERSPYRPAEYMTVHASRIVSDGHGLFVHQDGFEEDERQRFVIPEDGSLEIEAA